MEISFKSKRIIVTGAGRGIGKGICLGLAKCGATVVAVSKTEANLVELKKLIPSAEIVCVDLGDWEVTRTAMKQIIKKPVHGLVNNAAIAHLEKFLDVSEDGFDQSFNINVKTVVNISQIIAKDMVDRKQGGAIVNVSSRASKAALDEHSVYCATKGALDALSRVMALELGKYNIRVNCVNPTLILTDMGRLTVSDPAVAKSMLATIPLGRFGEVDEVVDGILFLLSDKASMITGIAMPIDGGFWLVSTERFDNTFAEAIGGDPTTSPPAL